jgi:hypothetical protein
MNTYKTPNIPAVLYHSKDRLLSDITKSKVEWILLAEQRKQGLCEICVH